MFAFGRNPLKPSAEFWKWWPTARDRIAQAIVRGTFDDRLINEITKYVHQVDRRMAWELQPGSHAAHALCLSPEGDPALRQAALRWLQAAPAADATWEYHASRQPARSLSTLQFGGTAFDLEQMRATSAWDSARGLLDVRLWHPRFADVDRDVRLRVALLFLDHLLGEDDVERWIGGIELFDAPAGGRTPAELKAEVQRRATEPSNDDTWILGTRPGPDGREEIVLADARLKRIDYPFHDTWVWVQMLWGADRYPTDAEGEQLEAEEDDFLRRMGDAAILAARVTAPGSRTWHFVTENFEGMRPAIDGWGAWLPDSLSPGLPQRRLRIDGGTDMAWAFQHELGIR